MTVFISSQKRGIYVAESRKFESAKTPVEISVDKNSLVTLSGTVGNRRGMTRDKTWLYFGNSYGSFLDEEAVGITDSDGNFALHVNSLTETLLVATEDGRTGWLEIDASKDAASIEFDLRPKVEKGELLIASPPKGTAFVRANYGTYSQFASPFGETGFELTGLPQGEPYLRVIWSDEVGPFDDFVRFKLGIFPKKYLNRSVTRKVKLDKSDMGTIEIPMTEETRKYIVRLEGLEGKLDTGVLDIEGYADTGEHFSTTHAFKRLKFKIEIPDFERFRIGGRVRTDSGEQRIYRFIDRAALSEEKLVLNLAPKGDVAISTTLRGFPEMNGGYVNLYRGTIESDDVFEHPDIHSMSLMDTKAMENIVSTVRFDHLEQGDYTLVAHAFLSEGPGPVAEHYVARKPITISHYVADVSMNLHSSR